ncbi:Fructose-2,6-bisphosphatase [Vanrija albida]|uniref:Fructose-2,6-bisphosphatase n=1 Tax=Vanrija albida TaxID=181172 RepID=A0ABR3QDF8_9TREE
MSMPPPGPPKSTVPATKSPLSRSPGTKSPSKSPLLKPLTPNNPPEAGTLADAISKIDSLRMSAPPSAATSPVPSGASSPGIAATVPPLTTAAAAVRRASGDIKQHVSPPATPHFGAQSDMLKTLDESTKILRANANAKGLERAPSVSGIGGVVEKPDYSEAKIVVAMVGLPARGKSYLSNKVMRYLRWLEYNVEVFNVGQLRRSKARKDFQQHGEKADHSAHFFSDENPDAKASREKLAEESLENLITWLKKKGGNVGIMDATNSTISRREKIRERVEKEPGLQLLYLESFCDDPALIAANVALKASSGDPDYKGMSQEEAVADFRKRIAAYEKVYQTISEPDISFCRIQNVGQQVSINRIESYLQSRIAFYLMNLHLKPRSIYLSRHGESMYNVEGKIGGDAELSPRGMQYAEALPDMVKKHIGGGGVEVWTSTLTRTIQTASKLPFEKKTWKALDELDAGVCDGMTYEEIEQKYPEDYEARDEDKFNYRYRGGESYRDVVVRLEPVIMELERQENILIIGHQAIIRCLYAYFMGLSQEELPYIKVPLHTLIKISPRAYGCLEERFALPIAAVDTHRSKPSKDGKNPTYGLSNIPSGDIPVHDTSARKYYDQTADSAKAA